MKHTIEDEKWRQHFQGKSEAYVTRNPHSTEMVSKIEKYKWDKPDKPGVFMMIDKAELHIPAEYQRKAIREFFITEVASQWKWVSCGTLAIVYRNGKAFVLDGQHRKLAADKRADIKELPCMVFDGIETIREEAQGFIDINLKRARVGSVDMFRASLAAGDENAVFVSKTIERSGLKVDCFGSTKTVNCIGTILSLAKADREMFTQLWPLFISVHQNTQIFADVIKGIWAVEVLKQMKNKTLLTEPFHSKLIRAGGSACLAEINRVRLERGKGGNAVYRDGILSVLSKKI